MLRGQKRKSRWSSKGLFGSKAAKKIGVFERLKDGDDDGRPKPNGVVTMSLDGCSIDDGPPANAAAARFRRSGSKVLSILGLRHNSGSRPNQSISSTPSEREVALAIVRDATIPSAASDRLVGALGSLPPLQTPIHHDSDASSIRLTTIAHTQSSGLLQSANELPIAPERNPLIDLKQPRTSPFEKPHKRKDTAGLRHSRSTPGFVHQLSHKLSNTFGHPTIVHRPNLRTRPSLNSVPTACLTMPGPADRGGSPQDNTNLSSYNESGSLSPKGWSTAMTSLESYGVSSASTQSKDRMERAFVHVDNITAIEGKTKEKPLTPIQEAPVVVTPTVVTVETTANAKIFFETHFDSVLAGHTSPRSQRRRDLEARLSKEHLSSKQREIERLAWERHESEYLRQTRVLKSKTNEMTGRRGIAVAGYEIVRILGKGSFGVVRLVREMDMGFGDLTLQDAISTPIPAQRQAPTDGQTSPRSSSNEAFRSAMDYRKVSHRQGSKKLRKDVYAMKVIRKSEMLRNSQEGHLRAERDFLVASEKSMWVVPLIASFQDNTNLYLVMEYMVGGDFLGLLIRKNILKEKKARWYIAEMIMCVEEAHKLRWIHRDVKPDNFLISASGHLKIADFGLAFDGHWQHDQTYFNNHRYSLMEKLGIKVDGDSLDRKEGNTIAAGMKLANILTGGKDRHEKPHIDGPLEDEGILQWRNRHGKRKLAKSVVGTSQYMAPEVIRGDFYDGRCDWWSIGIMLYECLYGWTPFVCDTRQDTKLKILNHAETLKFPSESETESNERVSHDAMDLINRILQEKEYRLCSKKYLLNDYQHSKRHPGQLVTSLANKHSKDYQGNYVYAEDATDIKAHPFFEGLSWDRLHLSRPPFVPDVKSRDDTKYFDEEDPISDVDDASSYSSAQEGLELQVHEATIAPASTNPAIISREDDKYTREVNELIRKENARLDTAEAEAAKKKDKAAAKEKKRPRDKLLRDKQVGRQVLEMRKQGAFLGYTYRRPKHSTVAEERGRLANRADG
ncbi:MAG: AGC NDR NDR kinase [Lasallia pustulata]|uniref:non-specific serine/threonine protein kinase n=1 Tax=Lasallia pustulata TaxID=136370 RepID=A0A5M8PVD2_9LECA|nr:MAG: AGC NDR NDR kinase [Lasallia pustulata]